MKGKGDQGNSTCVRMLAFSCILQSTLFSQKTFIKHSLAGTILGIGKKQNPCTRWLMVRQSSSPCRIYHFIGRDNRIIKNIKSSRIICTITGRRCYMWYLKGPRPCSGYALDQFASLYTGMSVPALQIRAIIAIRTSEMKCFSSLAWLSPSGSLNPIF